MNLYIVTLVDGKRVEVNAETLDDAIRETQSRYGQAVVTLSHEKEIKEAPPSTFESLQQGGPNH